KTECQVRMDRASKSLPTLFWTFPLNGGDREQRIHCAACPQPNRFITICFVHCDSAKPRCPPPGSTLSKGGLKRARSEAKSAGSLSGSSCDTYTKTLSRVAGSRFSRAPIAQNVSTLSTASFCRQ